MPNNFIDNMIISQKNQEFNGNIVYMNQMVINQIVNHLNLKQDLQVVLVMRVL